MQSKLVAKANGANYATLEGLGLLSMFSVAVVGALMINYQIIDSSLLTSSTYALYGALGIRAIISFNTELMKAMGVYDSILTKIGAVHETDEYKQ